MSGARAATRVARRSACVKFRMGGRTAGRERIGIDYGEDFRRSLQGELQLAGCEKHLPLP